MPAKASIGGISLKSLSGSFATNLGGTYNPSTGTGTFTGSELIKFSKGKLGLACLTFTSNVTNKGANESGTFQLAGGTKVAARTRLSGSFTETVNQTGNNGTVSGSVKGKGKTGASARPLTSACRALQGQL